eukprot:TRINITY_DN8004_c0_g1_i1.p1 TRINITY_DN8004_c0_g1~~TRINITY_DN8004_c0_g1_i1.p1  ORF type:complete len:185 (+),score=14.65 TRINITY_DN8004_c0_g1_i1:96-650(+)
MHAFIERKFPEDHLSRTTLFKTSFYRVGNVILSLVDIEHAILRGRSSKPSIFGASLFISRFSQSDPRFLLTLRSAYPQLSFVLCHFATSSPPLRAVTVENIDHLLHNATRAYLKDHVIVSETKVHLPKLLEWYKRDFAKDTKGLLQWVGRFLDVERREKIGKAKVIYQEFKWDFVFRFQGTDIC